MVYSPGQFLVVYPFLPAEPKWLILGGPASANEAQTARLKWPGVRVIGIEPNPEAVEWQVANGWLADAPLLPFALSDRTGETLDMVYASGQLNNARLDKAAVDGNRTNTEAIYRNVETITLDDLNDRYGPFEDAVLWIDVECSEYKALCGAKELLASGRVVLIDVEEMTDSCEDTPKIRPLLESYGYRVVHEWNASDTCRDRIYVKG